VYNGQVEKSEKEKQQLKEREQQLIEENRLALKNMKSEHEQHLQINQEEFEKERIALRKGFDDTTEDLCNKMESEFLISKADTVPRMKDNFEAETEALKAKIEKEFKVQLSDVQSKNIELEERALDATLLYQQSFKTATDHKVYGERMEETLKGQLQEKDKELKALAEAKQNIEGEYDKRLATLTQADEMKKKKLQEEKLKSLEVVDNAKKNTERLQRQLKDSKREAENMRHSSRMMIGSFTINTQTARKEVKAPINPKDRAMRLHEKSVNKRANELARQVINNTIDLSKQTASVMTAQTVQQSLPQVFETVDAEMTDVPQKTRCAV
jgi:hypothetical protein